MSFSFLFKTAQNSFRSEKCSS